MFPNRFVSAGQEYSTLEKSIPAPYIRKSFVSPCDGTAVIVITGLGFYDAFVNGARITKGILAPYVSAPDDVVCYDRYEVDVKKGENVLGVILGNGMQNSYCGFVWDFDKAAWRGVPETAFSIEVGGKIFDSGDGCKWHRSPIVYDDERGGEYYDARLELEGWSEVGFDDSDWSDATPAREPKGEKRFCIAEPIVTCSTLTSVSRVKTDKGWLYDFGVNAAGNPLLTITGKRGQTVTVYCGELLIDGVFTQSNLVCDPRQPCQVIKYTLRGEGVETYTPCFTYNGFRYALVEGLEDEQATADTLKYLVQNSGLSEDSEFECSDETVNELWRMTKRSTLANFYYFPTDCPHREKNGWTGDAAVSAEQTMQNFGAEKSYEEWLVHIRAVQREDGAIPGIIPTGGWGFAWGAGPAWDTVIVTVPYFVYLYRRNKKMLEDNADAIDRYLTYMKSKLREDGIAEYGLGDWCSPNRPSGSPKTPLAVTDTLMCIDICAKAKYIFTEIGQTERAERARAYRESLLEAFRTAFVDGVKVKCMTQTAQAMALYYGVFSDAEYNGAYKVLRELIEENDGMHDCGILGCRTIFHVLSANGDCDLALSMITSKKHPGFGNWIERGATSLWENFPKEGEPFLSLNHHFYGNISNFFFRELAGIRVDEGGVTIEPHYASSLTFVKASILTPEGRRTVEWKRTENGVSLDVK